MKLHIYLFCTTTMEGDICRYFTHEKIFTKDELRKIFHEALRATADEVNEDVLESLIVEPAFSRILTEQGFIAIKVREVVGENGLSTVGELGR